MALAIAMKQPGRSLIQLPPRAIVVWRDADLYRLAAIVIATCDRLGFNLAGIARIDVYRNAFALIDLPLPFDRLSTTHLDRTVARRTGLVVKLLPGPTGSVLLIDLLSWEAHHVG